jgi:hypothetical protein
VRECQGVSSECQRVSESVREFHTHTDTQTHRHTHTHTLTLSQKVYTPSLPQVAKVPYLWKAEGGWRGSNNGETIV